MTNIFLFQLNKIFDEPLPNMSKFDHIPRWAPDQARWYDGVGQGHGRQSKTRLGAATAVYSLLGNPRPPIGLYNTIYTIYYIYILYIYYVYIYTIYRGLIWTHRILMDSGISHLLVDHRQDRAAAFRVNSLATLFRLSSWIWPEEPRTSRRLATFEDLDQSAS